MRVIFHHSLFISVTLGSLFVLTSALADPYAKSGNIKPAIVELSAEEEAKSLPG